VKQRTFVRVTFRESEPFYGEKTDLSALFQDLDYTAVSLEGDSSGGGVSGIPELQQVSLHPLVGVIPVRQDNNKAGGSWAEGAQQQGRWNNPPHVYAWTVDGEQQELPQNPAQG
jgi:hypothetical protein